MRAEPAAPALGRVEAAGDAVIALRQVVRRFGALTAVDHVDLQVQRGEVFGLLGPNGAGKTTSIKCVLRLIHQDEGTVTIFGRAPGDREAVRRLGYMPENPYIYQYLRPLEFLDLCGRLMGMSPKDRAQRSDEMLTRVGLDHARDRPIGKFSKGMMQRVGLAQSLLHDPDLLVLDEPMSGLDPIGRKEVRDLLVFQRAQLFELLAQLQGRWLEAHEPL